MHRYSPPLFLAFLLRHTESGRCPDRQAALTIELRTDWFPFYSIRVGDTQKGNKTIFEKNSFFVVNRRYKETICLDHTEQNCYEFSLADSGGEGLIHTDGNWGYYSLVWDEEPLVHRGTFEGPFETISFGLGCPGSAPKEL